MSSSNFLKPSTRKNNGAITKWNHSIKSARHAVQNKRNGKKGVSPDEKQEQEETTKHYNDYRLNHEDEQKVQQVVIT